MNLCEVILELKKIKTLFLEDNHLKRKGHSLENFNLMAKLALTLIFGEKFKKNQTHQNGEKPI